MSLTAPVAFEFVARKKDELGPYAAFGAWLRDRRMAAKLGSQPQAEIRARSLKLRLINQGKLSHIPEVS